MEYVLSALILAVLCSVWVLVQLLAGHGPRVCKGDGRCERDGLGSCSRPRGKCAATGTATKGPASTRAR